MLTKQQIFDKEYASIVLDKLGSTIQLYKHKLEM